MPRSLPAYRHAFGEASAHGLVGFSNVGGNRFRVGPCGYRVNALGYDADLPRLSPVPVAILDEGDKIVVRTEIHGNEPVEDGFYWRSVPPVDLAPGLTYRLAAYIRSGEPAIDRQETAALSDELEDLGSFYAAATSLECRHGWEYSGSKRGYSMNMRGYAVRPMPARHREIVDLASQGLTDKEIARELGIGVATIDTYWKRLRELYGVTSRTAVVARALDEMYRQAHRALALEREETIHTYDQRKKDEEASIERHRETLAEIARLRSENARLIGQCEWASQALTAVEASGVIVYDEARRWCTDNIRQLGIDPIRFRAGETTVSERIRVDDVRPIGGTARMCAFRVANSREDRWVLEIRSEGKAACALLLDHIGQIDVAEQAKLFEYMAEGALAMWRRHMTERRKDVEGYRLDSPFETAD